MTCFRKEFLMLNRTRLYRDLYTHGKAYLVSNSTEPHIKAHLSVSIEPLPEWNPYQDHGWNFDQPPGSKKKTRTITLRMYLQLQNRWGQNNGQKRIQKEFYGLIILEVMKNSNWILF